MKTVVSKKHRACLAPFLGYKSAGPYVDKNGRLVMHILGSWPNGQTQKTFLYARYLLIISTGVFPSKGLDVDHIDGNRLNDTIGNLQWLDHIANIKKSKMSKEVELICPHCSKTFRIPLRKTHLAKGGFATYCGRSCAYHSRLYLENKQAVKYLNEDNPSLLRSFEKWEDFSTEINSDNVGNFLVNGKNTSIPLSCINKTCPTCKSSFYGVYEKQRYCCKSCIPRKKKISEADIRTVVKDILDGKSNWTKAGKLLGTSDNAIRKRAKSLNLL